MTLDMADPLALLDRIGELEQEVESLKARERFFREIFNTLAEELILLDSEYRVVDANQSFMDITGLSREQVIGCKCYEIFAIAGRMCRPETESCPLHIVKRTGKKVEMRTTLTAYGTQREVLKIAYPVFKSQGQVLFVLEVNRDLTESRSLARHLKHTEQRFQMLLNSVSDAIVSTGEDQKILIFNSAAERMFQYSSHEVLGKDLMTLIPPQDGEQYQDFLEFFKTRAPKILDKAIRLKAKKRNNLEFPVELGLSCFDSGSGLIFTAIIRDISQQLETEKRLLISERLAAMGKTVAHVVHELKTPLMIIGGLSQQLLRSHTDPAAIKKLEIVCEEVARLERLVKDLGDVTKEQRLVKRWSNVNDLIMDVVRMMTNLPSQVTYEFICDLWEGDLELECDPDKLKQVFINLVANAMESMEKGGKIWIESRKKEGFVEITIRDQGVGIKDEELPHIFEPFFTTRKKGTGLGLSISYKIVEAHHGRITADSIPGKGTTIQIQLPL